MSVGYVPPAFVAAGHLLFGWATSAIIDAAVLREDLSQNLNPKRQDRTA